MTPWACRRLRPLLVETATGDASLRPARALEEHLEGCAACREEMSEIRTLAENLRGVPAREIPDDFWRLQRQSIMRRVREAPAPRRAAFSPGHAWRYAGLVAAGVVLALALIRQPSPGPSLQAASELEDPVLADLHDVIPVIAPATAIDDVEGDLLAVQDLGDAELDLLVDDGGHP